MLGGMEIVVHVLVIEVMVWEDPVDSGTLAIDVADVLGENTDEEIAVVVVERPSAPLADTDTLVLSAGITDDSELDCSGADAPAVVW